MEIQSFTRRSKYGSRTAVATKDYKGRWDIHLTHQRKRSTATWKTKVANVTLARHVVKDWIALEADTTARWDVARWQV